MKKLISLALVLIMVVGLLPVTAVPQAVALEEAGFTYTIENGGYGNGAYITDYSGGADAVVPKQLGGADVVSVEFYDKGLQTLDVSAATALTVLYCTNNQLTELDVSKNTALTQLDCYNNQLTELDVSNNTALRWISCTSNQLTELDLSKNTALTLLYCYDNQLTELDVSKNTALTKLDCYNNQLTELDVSKNTALTYLCCYYNQLTGLDVSKNTALTVLYCTYNQLTELDVSNNTALTELYCYSNQLTALDVSQNTALTELICSNNQLTAIDLSKNTALTLLYCHNNQLTALDVSQNTALTELICSNNQLTAIDLSKNTALTLLYCHNNQLTALDVSKNTALVYLYCGNNQLTKLDVSKNTALIWLDCHSNQLTTLDVSKNTALIELSCDDNVVVIGYSGGSGINYNVTEVTVSGSIPGFSINLNAETITSLPTPTYTPAAYSVDGGNKWKAYNASVFSDANFPKLLNKDLELQFSDQPIAKATKKPAEGANIVTFPKIKKRAAVPKLVINYSIAADQTGATPGEWVLTEKNGTTAVKTDIQIGEPDSTGKKAEKFGVFQDGASNGIGVKPLTGAKPDKAVYFIRTAPKPNADGTYTAASKPKKITAAGQQKAPSFKVDATKKLIKVKAGTIAQDADGVIKSYTAKDEITVPGKYDLWMAATAKKPATAKQPLTIS